MKEMLLGNTVRAKKNTRQKHSCINNNVLQNRARTGLKYVIASGVETVAGMLPGGAVIHRSPILYFRVRDGWLLLSSPLQ